MSEDFPLDKIEYPEPHFIAFIGALAYLFLDLQEDYREALLVRLNDLVAYMMTQSGDNMSESERVKLRGLHALFLRQVRREDPS